MNVHLQFLGGPSRDARYGFLSTTCPLQPVTDKYIYILVCLFIYLFFTFCILKSWCVHLVYVQLRAKRVRCSNLIFKAQLF